MRTSFALTLISFGATLTATVTNGSVLAATNSNSDPHPSITRDLAAWTGMGDAAVLYTDPSSQGLAGGTLYTLVNTGADQHAKASMHRVMDHVQTATFSPDGRWLAVTQVNLPKSLTKPETEMGWIVSVDGKYHQRIWSSVYDEAGDWLMEHGQPVYVYGRDEVHSVKPHHKPNLEPLSLPAGTAVNGIRSYHHSSKVAVWTVRVPGASGSYNRAYDEIGVWQYGSKALHTWVRSKNGEGLVLGPWTADGQGVFFWGDPVHSASILSDGTMLHQIYRGHQHAITVTLSDVAAVNPMSGSTALLRIGGSRYWYDSKHLAVWSDNRLKPIAYQRNTVQNWPTLNPVGNEVAYVQGTTLTGAQATHEAVQAWWRKLVLVTTNWQTGKTTQLRKAGHGVTNPRYDANGDRILYIEGNQLLWIGADGSSAPRVVMTLHAAAWKPYPQQASQSLTLLDYVAKPTV